MKQNIALYIAGLLLFSACQQHETLKKEPAKFCLTDSMRNLITLDSARYCDVQEELQLSGEVSFDENKVNKVFPRSSGQVVESRVSLGDKVEAGQVLAVIRSAEVASNYADIESAEADVRIAKRQLDNAESLYKSGIGSERDYTEASQNYQKALAAKRKLEATLNINGGTKTSNNGIYYLTAPISGYIVEKKVNAGNFIRPDMGDYLFTISDLKDVWVWANVFEADVRKIHAGDKAAVTTLAYPDKVFSGIVNNISEVLDPVNKAMKVRIQLTNSDFLLKPEMFTKVVLTINNPNYQKQAVCISKKALIDQDGKTYVVVYNSDCDLRIVAVEVDKTLNDKVYVRSGLQPGDKVITQNELLIFQQLLNE